MNNFLRTRAEVDNATEYLANGNFVASGLSCKNWEIASVIPYLKDGAILDMGSDGSVVLDNAVKLGLKGKKYGIDLAYAGKVFDITDAEVFYIAGDLMNTPFAPESFDIITCLSVIEHEVDFFKFAKECSRLLKPRGKLYCSFDFWNPKPQYEKRKLYSLDWNILDKKDVKELVLAFGVHGMFVTDTIDWTTQDAVINSTFCSPVQGVEYTFGLLEFVKK